MELGERLDKRTAKIHPKFMPLSLLFQLIKIAKRKIDDLEANILAYRSGGRGLVIDKPNIPIKVTPELDSIVIHLFADGAAGEFTPSYTQKNKETLDNFIRKLENCFGNFKKSIYFTQGKYQVKFPKAITDILSKYYSIKSYNSYKSKIPEAILKRKESKFKLACIIAFIVDEGNIRDVISLYSANKGLLNGIKNLTIDCNYICSKISFNKKSGNYSFTISTYNLERFYQDIKGLSKEFPTCNLSFKEKEVVFILNRRKIINPKNRLFTEKKILNIIQREKATAQQISKLTNYAYCTIIHNLKRLLNEGKLKRTKSSNKTYIWELA
ncbi:hypothetical protein J4466_05315 [Candidatus Pacearchaeota archaeon]|nr:hypothetical protein [Candidatus Pacearchaeota archaeon]